MISLAAIGIELKVRSNKRLTKKATNHLYIYFSRRNLVDKIICIRGNNAIDLITGDKINSIISYNYFNNGIGKRFFTSFMDFSLF